MSVLSNFTSMDFLWLWLFTKALTLELYFLTNLIFYGTPGGWHMISVTRATEQGKLNNPVCVFTYLHREVKQMQETNLCLILKDRRTCCPDFARWSPTTFSNSLLIGNERLRSYSFK